MIIRSEQMTVFSDIVQRAFRKRVAVYLRKHLPEHTSSMGDQELEDKVDVWQARASQYAIITERAIAKWCFLAMVAGDTFDEQPLLHEYLSRSAPDPATKVDTLMDALYVRLRQAEASQ